jgi:uncharacterized membrane protein
MIGIFSALICTLFGTTRDLISKKLAHMVHGNISALASFLYAIPWYLLFLGILYAAGYPVFDYTGAFLWLVFFRGITDTFAEFFKMHALARGDVSFIANFLSLAPLFLLFTAPLITGETISGIGLLGVLLICLGTILFMYHPLEKKQGIPWIGIIFAVLSSFFFSLNACFDRLAVQQADPLFSGFAMTVLSALFLLLPLMFVKEIKKQFQTGNTLFHIRGLMETLFMTTKLYALQYLEPQYVASIVKLGLVFSIVGGSVLFHEEGGKRRLWMSLLIILGTLLIGFSKYNDGI